MAFNPLDFPRINLDIMRVYPKFQTRLGKVAVPAHL